jgi:hypothetical protein
MAQPPQVDDDGAGPEHVTPQVGSECPECKAAGVEDPTIFPKGRQTPAAALAWHRQREHGVSGRHNPKARKAAAGTRAAREKTPPTGEAKTRTTSTREAMRDAAGAAGAGAGTAGARRAPSANDWSKGLQKVFGYGSVFVAGRLVDGDPRIELADDPEAERARIIERLSLDPEDAALLSRTPARILHRSNLNRRYGRVALDSLDGLDVVVVLAEHVAELARYRRERERIDALYAAGWRPGMPIPGGAPGPAAGAAGGPPQPPPAGAPPGPAPGPTTGVVMTPDMVAAMRRQRGEHINGSAPTYVAGAGPSGME